MARIRDRVRPGLGWAVVVAVVVATQAVLFARPSRFWAAERMSMREGIDAWGAATFLCGLALVGLLIACVVAERWSRWRWAVLLLPAAGFGWAAHGAWLEWRALLAERDGPRDYELIVPDAFPVAIWSCVAVAVLTVLVVVTQVARGWPVDSRITRLR